MESDQLNIPSTVSDPHYRYKMPRIQTVIQGSGNGIKTKWLNLAEVSNALKVPIEYPLKFIGRELGSNTEIKTNSYLINGNHTIDKMQEILDKFIKKYVLCPKCKLPEIHGKIQVKKEKKEIKCKCRSCGAVSKLDSTHDFASYIQRSPPPYEKDTLPNGNAGEKEVKKSFDKNTKKAIKECSEKIPTLIDLSSDYMDNCNKIKNLLNQYNFPIDIKFYVLANGILENLYTKAFEIKIPIIKYFIEKESENKNNEALFFFLVGMGDFIFMRKNEKNAQYLSSVLYYLYDKDILSEDYWKSILDNKEQIKYKSLLYNNETEKKFLKACEDFSNWINNGPYEGEEEVKKEEEKKEEEKKEEEIDIDNI